MATDWKAVESQYYMFAVRRQPIVLVRGEGTRVWDDQGKEYLDFTAGWAVNNVGHANPVVADAIAEQARTLLQTSNQFYTVPQLQAGGGARREQLPGQVCSSATAGPRPTRAQSSSPGSTAGCTGTARTR